MSSMHRPIPSTTGHLGRELPTRYGEAPKYSQKSAIDVEGCIDGMTTLMLADFDAETRFQLRASRGQGKASRGIDLLERA